VCFVIDVDGEEAFKRDYIEERRISEPAFTRRSLRMLASRIGTFRFKEDVPPDLCVSIR
jgi:hypothetical protein